MLIVLVDLGSIVHVWGNKCPNGKQAYFFTEHEIEQSVINEINPFGFP